MIKKKIIEDKHINILKYITYQGIYINNDLLMKIYLIDNNKQNIELDNNKINRIKTLIDIFKNICIKNNINHLYYILILETLNNDYIRNIFRIFNYSYIRLQNSETDINNFKLKFVKFKYNLVDFNSNDKPLELLVDLLKYLKDKDLNIILFFIICINNFFT